MTIYYDDFTGGLDSNNGTSELTPWKTVNKVNISSFNDGDTIKFKKGEEWREEQVAPSSGSIGSPITFGSYGSGADPIVTGADVEASWTADAGEEIGGLFASGIEDEVDAFTTDFDGKTEGGSTTLVTSTTVAHVNNGVKGAYVDIDGVNGDGYAYKTFTSSTECYIRIYFKLNTGFELPAAWQNCGIGQVFDGATELLWIRLAGRGDKTTFDLWVAARAGIFGDVYLGSSEEVTKNVWHYVEIRFFQGTGADGGWQVWLDGNLKASDLDNDMTSYEVDKIYVGSGHCGINVPIDGSELYFDDVKVDTSYIGAYAPAADGYYYASNYTGDPFAVIKDGAFLQEVANKVDVDDALKWWWDDPNDRVYVLFNPSGITMEIGVRANAFDTGGQDFLTIDGLDLQGATSAAFNLANGSTDVTLQNSTLSKSRLGFGHGNTISNITLDGNIIEYLTDDGIETWSTPTSGWIIRYNIVRYAAYSVMGDGSAQGILIAHADVIAEGNIVHHCGLGKGDSYGSHGIYADVNSSGVILRYNDCYENMYAGIKVAGDDTEVYYNLLHDGDVGVVFEQGCTGGKLYNNVIYGHQNDDPLKSDGAGLIVRNDNTVLAECKNNIFYNNYGWGANRYQIKVDDDTGNDITTSDYNLIFGDAGAGEDMCVYKGANKTFAEWQGLGYDANGLSEDPLMIDPSSGDFTLQSTSPCINAGVDVGFIQDYAGNPVPQGSAPDIGAFERQMDEQRRRRIDGKLLVYQY